MTNARQTPEPRRLGADRRLVPGFVFVDAGVRVVAIFVPVIIKGEGGFCQARREHLNLAEGRSTHKVRGGGFPMKMR